MKIWRPIPKLPGRFASNYGQVASVVARKGNRASPGGFLPVGMGSTVTIIRGEVTRGMRVINARIDGRPTKRTVGECVLEAHVGPRPDGHRVAHLNGNGLDDRLQNLRWMTQQELLDLRRVNGTMVEGERHGLSKLTESDVIEIVDYLETTDWSQHEIGEMFCVANSTICDINRGRAWRHITGGAPIRCRHAKREGLQKMIANNYSRPKARR